MLYVFDDIFICVGAPKTFLGLGPSHVSLSLSLSVYIYIYKGAIGPSNRCSN